MQMATSGVQFSFNNTMYRETIGIAMGSPLDPVLANVFVGYNENKLFDLLVKAQLHKRYWMTPSPFLKMKPNAMNFLTF